MLSKFPVLLRRECPIAFYRNLSSVLCSPPAPRNTQSLSRVTHLACSHQPINNQFRNFATYSFAPDNSSISQLVRNRVFVFLQGKNIIKISRSVFDACEEQTYAKDWYSRGKLASSFRDKHLLLVIHIWMCHRRLVGAYGSGEDVRADRLQECLFDFLWDDSTTRIFEAKVSSLFINKYLKQVQSLSFHICHELDTALALPFVQTGPSAEGEAAKLLTDEQMKEAVISKVGEVIWNHFYDSNPDMEEAHVLEFARYILEEQHRVQTDLPYEQFITGDLQWSPVPVFKEPLRPGIKAGQGPGRKWKPLGISKE